MIPPLPELALPKDYEDTAAYQHHLLCRYADLMEHLYLYQTPNLIPQKAFPFPTEYYVLFDDLREKTRFVTLQTPDKKASAPSQSTPASTA